MISASKGTITYCIFSQAEKTSAPKFNTSHLRESVIVRQLRK